MCSDEANIKVEVAYGAIPDSPGRDNTVRPKNHVNTPFWGFRGYQNVPTQGVGRECDANGRTSGNLEGLRRHHMVPMGQSRDSTDPEGWVVTLLALVFHELGSTGGRRPVMP